MKKTIVIIVLAVLAGLVVVDLAKSDDNGTKAPAVSQPTTTVPSTTEAPVVNNNDAEVAATCVVAMGKVTEGLNTIQSGTSLLPYVSDADAKEFLATAKDFVHTSIETVKLCAYLAPVEASQTLYALSSLETAIDNAASLY